MIRKWLLTLSLGSALALLAVPFTSSTAQAGERHGHYVVRRYDHYRYHYGPRVIIEPTPVYVTPGPIYVQPVPTVIQTPAPVLVTPGN
jgi:hypothetical protein